MGTNGEGRREGDFLGYLKSEAGAAYDATLFGPEAARIEKGRARPCRISTVQCSRPQPLVYIPPSHYQHLQPTSPTAIPVFLSTFR